VGGWSAHGPVVWQIEAAAMQLWEDMVSILKAPFVADLDLVHLFLLVGLVLVFVAAWSIILSYVRDAATEVIE
jgi:hypothetical protein